MLLDVLEKGAFLLANNMYGNRFSDRAPSIGKEAALMVVLMIWMDEPIINLQAVDLTVSLHIWLWKSSFNFCVLCFLRQISRCTSWTQRWTCRTCPSLRIMPATAPSSFQLPLSNSTVATVSTPPRPHPTPSWPDPVLTRPRPHPTPSSPQPVLTPPILTPPCLLTPSSPRPHLTPSSPQPVLTPSPSSSRPHPIPVFSPRPHPNLSSPGPVLTPPRPHPVLTPTCPHPTLSPYPTPSSPDPVLTPRPDYTRTILSCAAHFYVSISCQLKTICMQLTKLLVHNNRLIRLRKLLRQFLFLMVS